MAWVNITSERDLEIKEKRIENNATGEVVDFEWQWMPWGLTVRVRFGKDRKWIVLDGKEFKCNQSSDAYHRACWYVRDMKKEDLEEVLK